MAAVCEAFADYLAEGKLELLRTRMAMNAVRRWHGCCWWEPRLSGIRPSGVVPGRVGHQSNNDSELPGASTKRHALAGDDARRGNRGQRLIELGAAMPINSVRENQDATVAAVLSFHLLVERSHNNSAIWPSC